MFKKKISLDSSKLKILSIFTKALCIEEKRRLAEVRKLETELKYRSLFDNVDEAVFIADKETNMLLEANKQAEELFGLSKRELIGMDGYKLYPQDKRDDYRKKFINTITEDKIYNFKIEFMKKNGSRALGSMNAGLITERGRNIFIVIIKEVAE